jgi:hypothetical protein
MPSSSIRVTEQSGSRLTVLAPAYYPAAIAVLSMVLLALLVFFLISLLSGHRRTSGVLLGALFILLVGVGITLRSTIAVFDFSTETFQVESSLAGITWRVHSYPLSRLEHAGIQRGRGTERLILQLTGGELVVIGGSTSQPGRDATAQAINDFLARGGKALEEFRKN